MTKSFLGVAIALAASLTFAVACDKKETAAAPGDITCEQATEHGLELGRLHIADGTEEEKKAFQEQTSPAKKAEAIAACKKQSISQERLKCAMASKTYEESLSCNKK